MSVLSYPLCTQTVTIYRKSAGGILRQVLSGCGYFPKTVLHQRDVGHRKSADFLLIVPGDREIFPDDRVIEGEGPVFTRWAELYDVPLIGSVKTFRWGNDVCHREGRGM